MALRNSGREISNSKITEKARRKKFFPHRNINCRWRALYFLNYQYSIQQFSPTPIRATNEETASARWCQAFAIISPLPSFSPAFFVIQNSLWVKPNEQMSRRSSNQEKLLYLYNGLSINKYPSLTDMDIIVTLKARTGWSMSIPWWCPPWLWICMCSRPSDWLTTSGGADNNPCRQNTRNVYGFNWYHTLNFWMWLKKQTSIHKLW